MRKFIVSMMGFDMQFGLLSVFVEMGSTRQLLQLVDYLQTPRGASVAVYMSAA